MYHIVNMIRRDEHFCVVIVLFLVVAPQIVKENMCADMIFQNTFSSSLSSRVLFYTDIQQNVNKN